MKSTSGSLPSASESLRPPNGSGLTRVVLDVLGFLVGAGETLALQLAIRPVGKAALIFLLLPVERLEEIDQ